VCGRSNDRYRIPDRLRTDTAPSTPRIRPYMSLQASDLAPCGLFQGERACGRNEGEQYGYGGGRNPVAFVHKVVDAIVDSRH
jgi:hypothetical protein